MRTPLVSPSIVVLELPRGKVHNDGTSIKPRRWQPKPKSSSYHFGLTSALASAATLRRKGIPVWIEQNGQRATRLAPSGSPALHDRLKARGKV